MEATQYQALVGNDWLFKTNATLDWNTQELQLSQNSQQQSSTYHRPKLICVDCGKKLSSIGVCCGNDEEYQTATKFYCCACCVKHFERPKRQLDSCPHNDNELWQMAIAKIEGASPEEIRTIKNNPPEPIKLDWDTEPVINFLEPKEFHKHYQNLAPTREEQKQQLTQLNTRLCCHCLIFSDFEYCDDCDLIYNPPPHMIYTISEEKEPISSCTSESESLINHDPDSDDDNKNTGFSSVQNGNDNKDNSKSDSNSDLNYKQYIALPDLSKEQKLK
ncbi:hypothetical protein G9A89_014032 [Geosiphon pyriformis]|nr:hypothetical protein G9A89_014032 [Geosiphon pyriformis]